MIRRMIIKAAEWELCEATSALTEETGWEAPRAVFRVECVTCNEESNPASNDSLPVEKWALEHTSRNPEHRRYRLLSEWFWIVLPARGNPYYTSEAWEGGKLS